MLRITIAIVSLLIAAAAGAGCPFGFDKKVPLAGPKATLSADASSDYVQAALALDWDSVYDDIVALFATNQKEIYPADSMLDGTTSYGPFFIREAWHCSGSYRRTDGLGGCAGGRQRFDPELSWPDNTNLDKGKRLLWPIKEKYGLGLSWGDLMILAGKVAIEQGGFPFIGFCAGRPDQEDGSQSNFLGPTADQEKYLPCPEQGNCGYPFGADTIGLIYVNPEGFLGDYVNLTSTAKLINQTFGFMSMNAEETVALIGGGHAFGKTHGACIINESNFLSPSENPENPWPVNICPNGTFTTGFEGYWSSKPSKWTNEFFQRITGMAFEPRLAAGGKHQYMSADAGENKMMLPSDISLLSDPLYKSYLTAFAANFTYLTEVFGAAWYKLTTRDMGPISRCLNITIKGKPQLLPAQAFQYPLPPAYSPLPDFTLVKAAIQAVLYTPLDSVPQGFAPDLVGGKAYWGALFMHAAFQCAATYRSTDHVGGCDGARILLPPQNGWVFNSGVDVGVSVLAPVKAQFGASLSNADLIVLAGVVAFEEATGHNMSFCGGRSDAVESYDSGMIRPTFNFTDVSLTLDWQARVRSLDPKELIAVMARPRSANQMARMKYIDGTWSKKGSTLNEVTNDYFNVLLNDMWTPVQGPSGMQYVNSDGTRYMTPADMRILWNPTYKNVAQNFASDSMEFLKHFKSGWVKMMNADRYDGPTGNLCK
jgi:catalase-peroxidase